MANTRTGDRFHLSERKCPLKAPLRRRAKEEDGFRCDLKSEFSQIDKSNDKVKVKKKCFGHINLTGCSNDGATLLQ